jgi:hypothetical protein
VSGTVSRWGRNRREVVDRVSCAGDSRRRNEKQRLPTEGFRDIWMDAFQDKYLLSGSSAAGLIGSIRQNGPVPSPI